MHSAGQRSLSIPSSVSSSLELIEVNDSVTGLTVSPEISSFCQSCSSQLSTFCPSTIAAACLREPALPQPSLHTRVPSALHSGITAFCCYYSHRFPVQISDSFLPFPDFSLTTVGNWSLLSFLQKGECLLLLSWTVRTALGDDWALCHLLRMSANGHPVTLTLRTEHSLLPDHS